MTHLSKKDFECNDLLTVLYTHFIQMCNILMLSPYFENADITNRFDRLNNLWQKNIGLFLFFVGSGLSQRRCHVNISNYVSFQSIEDELCTL